MRRTRGSVLQSCEVFKENKNQVDPGYKGHQIKVYEYFVLFMAFVANFLTISHSNWMVLLSSVSSILLVEVFLLFLFWAIVTHFEPLWAILSQFEPFWAILSSFEPLWAMLSHFGPFWAFMSLFEPFWAILSHFEPFQAIWTFFTFPTFKFFQTLSNF